MRCERHGHALPLFWANYAIPGYYLAKRGVGDAADLAFLPDQLPRARAHRQPEVRVAGGLTGYEPEEIGLGHHRDVREVRLQGPDVGERNGNPPNSKVMAGTPARRRSSGGAGHPPSATV